MIRLLGNIDNDLLYINSNNPSFKLCFSDDFSCTSIHKSDLGCIRKVNLLRVNYILSDNLSFRWYNEIQSSWICPFTNEFPSEFKFTWSLSKRLEIRRSATEPSKLYCGALTNSISLSINLVDVVGSLSGYFFTIRNLLFNYFCSSVIYLKATKNFRSKIDIIKILNDFDSRYLWSCLHNEFDSWENVLINIFNLKSRDKVSYFSRSYGSLILICKTFQHDLWRRLVKWLAIKLEAIESHSSVHLCPESSFKSLCERILRTHNPLCHSRIILIVGIKRYCLLISPVIVRAED